MPYVASRTTLHDPRDIMLRLWRSDRARNESRQLAHGAPATMTRGPFFTPASSARLVGLLQQQRLTQLHRCPEHCRLSKADDHHVAYK